MIRKLLRVLAWTVAGLIGLVIVSLIAGAVYQSVAASRDAERFPPPGELIDIGTHSLHLDCRGRGSPMVLLESGAQLWSSGWRRIHEALALHTRTCAYDRSGLGWSEIGPPPYDAENAVAELQRLLDAAGEERPFVFVGHSLGGMLAQIYHARFPDELAGVVIIDGGSPQIVIEDFEARRDDPIRPCGLSCQLPIFAARVGVVRIALNRLELLDDPALSADAVAEFRALAATPQNIRVALMTARYIGKASFQVLDTPLIADIPVTVIYGGEYGTVFAEYDNEEELIEWRGRYMDYWQSLVSASSSGRGPVEIPGANHVSVITHEPYAEQVAAEILATLETIP